jgi:hypothetical protein
MDHYAATFADSQRTQNIRQRLLRTLTLLDAGLEIANGCVAHCQEMESPELSGTAQAVLSELRVYSSQMRSHKNVVSSLVEHSRGTMELAGSAHLLESHGLTTARSSLKSSSIGTVTFLVRALPLYTEMLS